MSRGKLVVVGTPIGNLADLGGASRRALEEADVVCAEDTRHARKLLSAYDIHPAQLVSVREHNEARMVARVLEWIDSGLLVALVTDAGMPTVSDPGGRVVHEVIAAGAGVVVAAGPDAATAALLVSGFTGEQCARWAFEGFLPVKGRERAERVSAVAGAARTSVLYEAPHRLLRTLRDLTAAAGPDREVVVVNDLTKRFERVWRGRISDVVDRLTDPALEPRGEFVVVLAAATAERPAPH